ncbi:uncharacterized protein LOC144123197 isoform X2 [Amblyomma americanum]
MWRNTSLSESSKKASSASRLRGGRCMGWHSSLEQQNPCSWSCGSAGQISVSRPAVSTPAPPSPVVSYRQAPQGSATSGLSNTSVTDRRHDRSGRQSSPQNVVSQRRMKKVRSVCFPMPGCVPLYRSPSLSSDIDAWSQSHMVVDDGTGLQNGGGALLPSFSGHDAWSREIQALKQQNLQDSRSSTGSSGMYSSSQATSIGIMSINIEPPHIKSPEPMNSLSRPLEFKPFPESTLKLIDSNALQSVSSARALRSSDRCLTKQPSLTSPERFLLQPSQNSASVTKLGSGSILSRSFTHLSPHPFQSLRQDTPVDTRKVPSDLARRLSPISVEQSDKKRSHSKLAYTTSREIQPSGFTSLTSQSLLQQQGKNRRETLPQLTPPSPITSPDYAAKRAGSLQSMTSPRQIEVSGMKSSITGMTASPSCDKTVSSASPKCSTVAAKSTTPMQIGRNLSTRAINVSRKKQGSTQALKQHSSSLTVLEIHPSEASTMTMRRSHSEQIDPTETIVPKG